MPSEKASPPRRWEGVEKPDWLSRALARAGALALSEAEAAIFAGRVSVAGRVIRQPLTPLAKGAVVKLDGIPVQLTVTPKVIVFHKPKDCLSSTARQHGVGTVFELLLPQLTPELARFQWHAVGRLDRDTTGLLLFTNDEKLLAWVTSPENKVEKRYLATVSGKLKERKVAPLLHGVELEDGSTAQAKRVLLRGPDQVEVVLTEGRNHQVKRMLGAVGFPVCELHREGIGQLNLDVEPGRYRLLTDTEVQESLGFQTA